MDLAYGTPRSDGGKRLAAETWPELPCIPLTVSRDAEIFVDGEPAERIYRVLSDGRRQVQAFYFPGDLFQVVLKDVAGLAQLCA